MIIDLRTCLTLCVVCVVVLSQPAFGADVPGTGPETSVESFSLPLWSDDGISTRPSRVKGFLFWTSSLIGAAPVSRRHEIWSIISTGATNPAAAMPTDCRSKLFLLIPRPNVRRKWKPLYRKPAPVLSSMIPAVKFSSHWESGLCPTS